MGKVLNAYAVLEDNSWQRSIDVRIILKLNIKK
jgi:hypothetical protein